VTQKARVAAIPFAKTTQAFIPLAIALNE